MGAQNFYNMADKLRDILLANDAVNTVTYGDITKVATEKTSIYPLSHFVVNSTQLKANTYVFSISLVCMDIIDQVNGAITDNFNGNDNQMDILNTQLAVITSTISQFRFYNLRGQGYQLIGEPTSEQFNHRFEDDVAGWEVTFDVEVVQDIKLCS
tara:strand:+ start:2581 stop:3045 length:465 start_codon:yes stop_codon:yes gene_type:complete